MEKLLEEQTTPAWCGETAGGTKHLRGRDGKKD